MSDVTIHDPRRQRWVLFSISLGSFMANVDTYSVNISLPTIARHFNAHAGEVAWVSLAYNLALASLLVTFGRLGDRVGLKRMFMAGFAMFSLGSLLCGISPNLPALVICRTVQGVAGAILFALTPAMIPKFFPAEKRGPAFGMLATITALGMTVGNPWGGFVSGLLSWHWIFFLNVPVGVMAALLCWRIIPDDRPESHSSGIRFDLIGALLSFVSALSFIYGLNMGRNLGWLSLPIIGCFIFSALTLGLFILRQKSVSNPLVDLSLFRNRAFTCGNIASCLAYTFLAGNNFLMPFYLELVKGLDSRQTGLLFLVYTLVYMMTGPLVGLLSLRISSRTLCTAATAFGALMSLGFALTLRTPGLTAVVIYFACFGITFATFTTSNNHVVMGMAPDGKQGVVAGLYRMIVRLGLAVGVCGFETILSATARGSIQSAKTAGGAASAASLLDGFHWVYLAGSIVFLMAMIASLLARDRKEKDRTS
jgi:EmrB/QacA subfamily drug resistance transporter